jgi:hypothetical protein
MEKDAWPSKTFMQLDYKNRKARLLETQSDASNASNASNATKGSICPKARHLVEQTPGVFCCVDAKRETTTSIVDNLRHLGSLVAVMETKDRGRGLYAVGDIPRGSFITGMPGELLPRRYEPEREYYQIASSRKRKRHEGEQVYAPSSEEIKEKHPDPRLSAHYANHAFQKKNQNAILTMVDKPTLARAFPRVKWTDRLIGLLQAQRDIHKGEEILWDYGYKEYPREWSREV